MVELEVIGRHALLFDDDANAVFVNSEEALVEWNSLLIDRYDVRHLLSGPPPPRNRRRQSIPPADASIAAELDRERFLDLDSPSDDEQELDVDNHEEPVVASGYHSVGFSYGNHDEATEQKNSDVESVYRPPFPVPESLTHNLPPTEKVHQIIARTAMFVSNQGGQSEIVLRVKQGNNPTFGFLMPDHHLHPYFRFLVDHQELLKSDPDGKQEKPGDTIPDRTAGALSLLGSVYGYEEDDEDVATEDLPAVKTNKLKENVDTISATVSHGSESSGNATVKNETLSSSNMKDKVHAIKRNPSISSAKSVATSTVKRDMDVSQSTGTSTDKTLTPGIIPPSIIAKVELPVVEPPSELKRVVDKIVEFILRNGKEFEAVLAEQDRKYGRFPFLLPSNQYHPYYLQVLQKTRESKSASKGSVSDKHESVGHRKERRSSHNEVDGLSSRTSERDIPDDYDKKEKFKMVLAKPKKDDHEPPPKAKQPQPEVVIDAEAAAAILMAATKGIKDPGLELFPKPSRSNIEDRSSNDTSQTQSSIRKKDDASVPAANPVAETAVTEADSSEVSLTKEQKLKAERLKRAKMFAAMVKNGAAPLKPEPLRSLSVEPPGSRLLSAGNEVVANPKVDEEREGSSAPVDVDTLEKIEGSENKVLLDECNDRRSKRSYRSRSNQDEENEEDGEDRMDRKHSRKKHRSHRSSRHSGDRQNRHRKRRSSSNRDDEKFSDDDDDGDRRSSRKRRKNRSSSDDEECHRRTGPRHHRGGSDKRRERRSEREAELEEGEISAKSDQSKACESGRGSREASLSRPSDSTEVPDDLRAKIRAMLMETMR